MAVPSYEQFMVPVLRVLSDGATKTLRQLRTEAADLVGLTDEDRALMIPSGTQVLFENRVAWASTYLMKATLVERPLRGSYRITEEGRRFLAEHPGGITSADLRTIPAFKEWDDASRQPSRKSTATTPSPVSPESVLSPQETIEGVIAQIDQGLADELIQRIYAAAGGESGDGRFLEEVSVKLLRAMGYGGRGMMAAVVGGSGDAGLDGIIHQDALGLDLVGVQAKCYEPSKTIGRPVIQSFVGALQGAQTHRGVFVTTARFSTDAKRYAENVPVRLVLIDGDELARLLLEHNLGVAVRETYALKEIDEAFFTE